MRNIEGDDLFLLSEIVDKMDIELPEIKTKGGLVTKKDQEEFGLALGHAMYRKIYKAKPEIYALLESITGESMKGKNIGEITVLVKQVLGQKDVINFIKSAVNMG